MVHAPPKVNILKCFLVKVDECSDLGVVRTGRRPCLCLDLLHDYLSHLPGEGRVPQTTTCVVSAKQMYKDVAFLSYKLLCMGLSWIPGCLVINWMMRINQDEKQSEIHNSLKMIKFLFSKLYGWERDFKKAKRESAAKLPLSVGPYPQGRLSSLEDCEYKTQQKASERPLICFHLKTQSQLSFLKGMKDNDSKYGRLVLQTAICPKWIIILDDEL